MRRSTQESVRSVRGRASRHVRLTALATAVIGLLATSPSLALTVIVDNADSGFAVVSGSAWTASAAPGHWGTGYVGQSTSDPAGEVEWRPDVPWPASMKWRCGFPHQQRPPNNACYTIDHAGGPTRSSSTKTRLRFSGRCWGRTTLPRATTGAVRLNSSAQANTHIVADAVRFSTGSLAVPEFRAFWAFHQP